jgi:hypothetical protein
MPFFCGVVLRRGGEPEYVAGSYSLNPYVAISRGIFSVPAHPCWPLPWAITWSLARFSCNQNLERIYLRKALVIPAILHGIFDFILMAEVPALLVFFIPYVLYLWVANLRKLNQYYKDSKEHSLM